MTIEKAIEVQELKSTIQGWMRLSALGIFLLFMTSQIAWAFSYNPSVLYKVVSRPKFPTTILIMDPIFSVKELSEWMTGSTEE